uniref:22alpha-hydroxysteroid 23-monooxygenase n=2 Tax=Kalanchoe fedtschenkoi TaxID=63787 RepID=A0A7N0UF13_KALFE
MEQDAVHSSGVGYFMAMNWAAASLWAALPLLVGFFWYSKISLLQLLSKIVSSTAADGGTTSSRRGVVPKGNPSWPLIGETLDFIASGYSSRPVTFMLKRKALYGKVFKTHILGFPIIVSTDAEVNKVILQNQGNVFIPNYPKSISELLGESSILQMNGSRHKKVHTIIASFLKSPHFKSRITSVIQHSVIRSLSAWSKMNQSCIYIQDETKKITFEVLVRVLMSLEPGEKLDTFRMEYMEFIKGLICIPVKFPGTRLYKSLKAKERMLKMVDRIVEERKHTIINREETTAPSQDLVDVLLRESTADSDKLKRPPLKSISGNIIEMMIPGEDTVPTAMTLAIKFLSDCPIALNQLVEENMEFKKRKVQSGEPYTWTDYMSLQFTQNVINETLRMANIINAVWRKALKDVEIDGYIIPKGWCVVASFTSVHMEEEIYENPYQFDPWRWERTGIANNNNLTPFGGGQRLCPGLELSKLEISIFLHHLVTTYRWEAEADKIVNFPTVKMRNRLPIKVTPLLV